MKTEIIAPENLADHEIGLEMTRVLKLRRKRDNGRIETTHGDKTPCGLARTLRALDKDAEAARAGMLAALREAAEFMTLARQHFPKSLRNSDKFKLETTCAAIGSAIHNATSTL
jgi:hypothetical protein